MNKNLNVVYPDKVIIVVVFPIFLSETIIWKRERKSVFGQHFYL